LAAGAEIPDDVVAAVEELFLRLEAFAGDWWLTFFASDGRLRKFERREEGGRDALARFNEPPLRPRGC
jgi:hypothetical protein